MIRAQLIAQALQVAFEGTSFEVALTSDELQLTQWEEEDGTRTPRAVQSTPRAALETGAAPFAPLVSAFTKWCTQGEGSQLGPFALLCTLPEPRSEAEYAALLRDEAWLLAIEQADDPAWWNGAETDWDLANAAAGLGNFVVLERALDREPGLSSARDPSGFALLHTVVERCDPFGGDGWVRCLALLVRRGADVNVENQDGNRPLHMARAPMVAPLVAAGAVVDARNRREETPLLVLASEQDSLDAMRALLEAGADANARDIDGQTASAIAGQRGEDEKVELLAAAASS